MKQAITLPPAQREQYYLELAPTDIEAVPVLMPDIAPTVDSPEQKRIQMIRQEYRLQQQIQQREQSQVSAQSGAVTLVKLAAIAAGGALVWQVATAFNPTALAITAGVVGIVGLLTYPGKRREDKPTWMPKSDAPVSASKQANVTINPVINVAVNVEQ